MGDRRDSPAEPQAVPPPEAGNSGWTTVDYMLAAGLAWRLAAASPLLIALPLFVSCFMSPPD